MQNDIGLPRKTVNFQLKSGGIYHIYHYIYHAEMPMYRGFVIDVTDVTHKNKLFRVKIDFQGECIEINANGKALASLPV